MLPADPPHLCCLPDPQVPMQIYRMLWRRERGANRSFYAHLCVGPYYDHLGLLRPANEGGRLDQ